MTATKRLEAKRRIEAKPAAVFAVLTDPAGHVTIDSSGMLQSAEGEQATKVGDTFTVHMDRESLGDYDLGKYDVTITFTEFEQDSLVEWKVGAGNFPEIGHRYGYQLEPTDDGGTLATSYYDWSGVDEAKYGSIFPVISQTALRATLGILARTLEQPATR